MLVLAYDGSSLSGFAPQTNARTVASVLTDAIAQMDPSAGALRVASRTDAGVHARGQVACFDTDARIGSRGWVLGLSAHLPPEVAVQRAAKVPAGFNPSWAARSKTYRYTLLRGTLRDPFWYRRAWRIHSPLDEALMAREAESLLGQHDFEAFRGSADIRTDTVRTIDVARFLRPEAHPRCLVFEIHGDRFLYRMVRIIVGTLVDVGRGRIPPGAVQRALSQRDRNLLGVTAPADGLCLERVHLAEIGEEGWPDHW